jgi:hypothetical protein
MKLLFLLLVIFYYICHSQAPGFKVVLSNNGLNKVKEVGMGILKRELDRLQVPEQHTRGGGADVYLSQFKFAVSFPNVNIGFAANQGINLQVNNLGLNANFHFRFKRYQFPKIGGSGNGHVQVSNTNMGLAIRLTNVNGKVRANVDAINFNIGNFNLKLGGSWGWLLNIVISLFKGKVKQMIENEIKKIVVQTIHGKLNDELATSPSTVNIGGGQSRLGLDYSLQANPIFAPSYVSIPMRGEFFNPFDRKPSSIQPSPSPDLLPAYGNKMLQAIITEYMPLTILEQWHSRNVLKFLLEDHHIPTWSPVRLDVASFAAMLPNLVDKFPQHRLKVLLATAEPPSIRFEESGLIVVFGVNMQWLAFKPGEGADKTAFVTKCTVTTKAIATIERMRVVPKLLFLSQKNQLISSEIGNFNPGVLDDTMNTLYNERGFIPVVNLLLSEGIPLPTLRYVALTNPQVVWGAKYLAVLTDLDYIGGFVANVTSEVDGDDVGFVRENEDIHQKHLLCVKEVEDARKNHSKVQKLMEQIRQRNYDKKSAELTEFFRRIVADAKVSSDKVCEMMDEKFPEQTCESCACVTNCLKNQEKYDTDGDIPTSVFNMIAECVDDELCYEGHGLSPAERSCIIQNC